MIKHIVMFKLKEMEQNQKQMVLQQIKSKLEALNGQIEGLVSLEVGIDFLQSDASYDLVLYAVLACKRDLEKYQNHPLHVQVANEVVKPAVCARIVVDYEF